MPRVNRTKTFNLVLRTETVYPALRGTKPDICGISMHQTIPGKSKLTFGVGYFGLPGSYVSFCVLLVYVTGQRRSSPGLMLGLSVLSSHHDGTCGER